MRQPAFSSQASWLTPLRFGLIQLSAAKGLPQASGMVSFSALTLQFAHPGPQDRSPTQTGGDPANENNYR